MFVEHLVRRESVGLFDANAIDAATIDHDADALARPGALRCSFGYDRALPTDRDDDRVWGETRLPMPVPAVGATGGYGPASARAMRRVATDVSEVLVERSGHDVPEERPDALTAAISEFLTS